MKDYKSILGSAPGRYRESYIKAHIPDLYAEIEALPSDLPFKERLYLVLHHMTKAPVCVHCGKPVTFNGMTHGYHEFCSQACSASSELTKNRRKETNRVRYGMDYYTNRPKSDQTKLERYGDPHFTNQEKKEKTNLERYGYKTNLCDERSKEKGRRTKLERYGDPHFTNQEKIKRTNIERYGYSCLFEDPEFRERAKEIRKAKYGDPNYNNREKRAQTNLERYGTTCNLSTAEQKQASIRKMMESYGVPYYCMTSECRVKAGSSKTNEDFAKTLDSLNISYEREFHINTLSYDFKVGNILIEINPSATHNSLWGIHGKPKCSTYHRDKTRLATSNGYRCINVWDWDDRSKILELLIQKTKIYARQCLIRELSLKETNDFLNKYHLQGTCKGQTIRFGLFYNGELVEVITFGKPRYNTNCEWELLRLCVDPRYSILGGSKRLFTHFIREYSPKSIISYCDMSKFSGDVYINLGFKLLRDGQPAKHWYHLRKHKHITDNLLRQRGFDQLFGTNYGKGVSNEQLMIDNKYIFLYDCGQNSYIWTK